MANCTIHPIETDSRIPLQDPEVLDAPHARWTAIRSIDLADRTATTVESGQRYAGLTQKMIIAGGLSRHWSPIPRYLH